MFIFAASYIERYFLICVTEDHHFTPQKLVNTHLIESRQLISTQYSMSSSKRCRFRDLLPNLPLGSFSPGPKNSITDIPDVTASTLTLSHPPNVLTGVTAILPHPNIFHNPCFAGIFRFNGNGELTGSHWIEETGLLTSPVMITNTFSVGAVSEGVMQFIKDHEDKDEQGDLLFWGLPIVVLYLIWGITIDTIGRNLRWIFE